MKFKNIKTGEIVNGDMFFINDYSDGGSASIATTMSNIEKDFTLV